jgi:hypothetical protein
MKNFQKSKYKRCLEYYIDNKGYFYQETYDKFSIILQLLNRSYKSKKNMNQLINLYGN